MMSSILINYINADNWGQLIGQGTEKSVELS